jgi:hypothetical protein
MLIGEWCCEELDVRDVFAWRMLLQMRSNRRKQTDCCSVCCPSLPPSLPPSLCIPSLPFPLFSLPFALFVSSLSLHLFHSFFLALCRENHMFMEYFLLLTFVFLFIVDSHLLDSQRVLWSMCVCDLYTRYWIRTGPVLWNVCVLYNFSRYISGNSR